MKYICEVTINKIREDVIKLFDSTENLYKWQKGLVSFEMISGEVGVNGLKSKMIYDENGKTMEMIETIEKFAFPNELIATYEAKNVWNRCVNTFEDSNNITVWKMESEFQCGGFMKLMTTFGKRIFMKQTLNDMNRFKKFAETNR